MENDEKKYEDVIKVLKGLQEVKAPANFEADLQRRINTEKFSKEEKKSFWESFFIPSRLIPSLGLVATAIVIFFVVETNSEEMDNPFLIQPRLREDMGEVSGYRELRSEEKRSAKQKGILKDERIIQEKKNKDEMKSVDDKVILGKEESGKMEGMAVERDYATDQKVAESFEVVTDSIQAAANIVESPKPTILAKTKSDSTKGQTVRKDELNFRQVQLTEDEQKTVNALKSQVQSLQKSNKSQK